MKPGTIVKMSESFKLARQGKCQGPGKHIGSSDTSIPDLEMPDEGCLACSWDHIAEFGNCIGIVEGPMFENFDAPEINVRWQPSKLRYGYHPDHLVIVDK